MPEQQKQGPLVQLAVLAEPNRAAILDLLKAGEVCACGIHPRLGLAQNLCSHHLKVLREAGLVSSRREGAKIMYSRNDEVIREYLKLLSDLIY